MFDIPLFLQAGTLVPQEQECVSLRLRGILHTYMHWSSHPPYQRSKKFCHNQTHTTITTNQTMAIHSSEFELIRECHDQVYAVERELLIFTKLIVINEA